MRLTVELYGSTIGGIVERGRSFDFEVDAAAIRRFGVNSRVLSAAIPLAPRLNPSHASRRRNFFEELLPEGDQLDFMVAAAGLRRGDILGFLARYGRDVAGALQIWDLDDPTEPPTPEAITLDEAGVRDLLVERQTFPLANAPRVGKTSLAGIQPKIVLARTAAGWAQVVGGYPSTHIVKPVLERYPTVIFDEEYGARLARRLGLAAHETYLDTFGGVSALVIERFDRDSGAPTGRLHQEDFNQALGARGIEKYQSHRGVVSLERVAKTLTEVGAADDRSKLASMVVMAVAIGNLDMHAKNLGLLHYPDGSVTLAPSYDVVPQTHLPDIDGELALAVNKQYRHASITRADLVAEISSWGVRKAEALVESTLERLRDAARSETPHQGAYPGLQDDVIRFAENLLAGHPAGRAPVARKVQECDS